MEANTVGMTNRQWQGWLRTIITLIEKMIESNPDKDLVKLLELFQSMLEDGTD